MKKRQITVKIALTRRMSSASPSPIRTAIRFVVCNQPLDTLIVPIKRKKGVGSHKILENKIGVDLDRCFVGNVLGHACRKLPCVRGGEGTKRSRHHTQRRCREFLWCIFQNNKTYPPSFGRKKNGTTGPPAPIQPVTREYDQNAMFRNAVPNNYGEQPHDVTDKTTGPEFVNGRVEPRIQSPSQNDDGQTATKLLSTPAGSYFTYNRVPWKLNIRKEVSGSSAFRVRTVTADICVRKLTKSTKSMRNMR